MGNILACFAFMKLFLCSMCISWLGCPPSTSLQPVLISLRTSFCHLQSRKEGCFVYFIFCFLVFLNPTLNGIIYISSMKVTFLNVKKTHFLKNHLSSPSCLFKADSFHCSASLCPQIPIQTILELPGCNMHGFQLSRFS